MTEPTETQQGRPWETAHDPRLRTCAWCRASYVTRSGNSKYCPPPKTCSSRAREYMRRQRQENPNAPVRPSSRPATTMTNQSLVLACLQERGLLHRSEVAAYTGLTEQQVQTAFVTLQREGKIERVGSGTWRAKG